MNAVDTSPSSVPRWIPAAVRGPWPMPPFWVIHSAPSGPSVAPFGPPPVSTATRTVPSAASAEIRPPVISVNSTSPSCHTGPSGNASPLATI